MKRILSLVLVLALVLGSVPVAFAAEQTAGEKLKEAGFVAGYSDGTLGESDELTRAAMMVLMAEMKGVKEEAKTFGIPAEFSDVNENDWFAPYVWYAYYQGWTTGYGDGTFGPNDAVDSKMAATFMLKALDYGVEDYANVEAEAAAVGVEVEASAAMTRGEGFEAMWATVNLPRKGEEVALGVELDKLEAPAEEVAELEATIDTVAAVGNAVLDVVFEDDVDAAAAADAANYTVTVKGGTTELEVKEVVVFDTDRVLVYTEAAKAGTAYTLTVGESAKNFTGLEKSSDEAEIKTVKGTDTGIVEVEFKADVDKATAEDIANYSIDRIGTVVAAELKDDLNTVSLTVEGFEKVQGAKLTVENVLSIDGEVMDKTTKTFYAKFDKDAPELNNVTKKTNTTFEISFTDDHGVDEATAEDVANYEVEGLEIVKVEAKKTTGSDYFDYVKVTTESQEKGEKYEVKVLYMVDGSTAKNATDEALEGDFRGVAVDEQEPGIVDTTVTALSLELFQIEFDEEVDPATVTDLANYEVQKDEFDILDIQFKDNDTDEKIIEITTSELDTNETYRIYVNNIADIYGNAMEDAETVKLSTSNLLTDEATYIAGLTVVDSETLEVEFGHVVTEDTATDPTNYTVDGDAALSVELKANETKIYTVKFNELEGNETFELLVNGVETYAGYAMEDAAFSFIVTADDVDETRPTVDSIDNEQDGMILVAFDEEVEEATATLTVSRGTEADSDTLVDVTFTLPFAAQTGDDDEVLAFDATKAVLVTAGASGLTVGNTYNLEVLKRDKFYITAINNVTDLAGNTPDYDSEDELFWTSSAEKVEFKEAEYEDVAQIDVKTIEVEYDIDLKVAPNTTVDVKDADGNTVATFDVDVDGSVVTLDNPTTIPEDGEDLEFDLNGKVTDLLGRAVKSETIELDGWDADDDAKPEILDVVAVDERTIEVYYDETIDSPGTYTIYEEDGKTTVTNKFFRVDVDSDDDSLVVLVLDTELNNDDFYVLKQDTKAKDLSGNSAEEVKEGIEFLGSSIRKVDNVIDGVVFVNAKTIQIKDDVKLPSGTYVVESNGTAIITVTYNEVTKIGTAAGTVAASATSISSKVLEIEITNDIDAMHDGEGQTYTVDITPTAATADADLVANPTVNKYETTSFEEEFEGIAEKLDITAFSGAVTTLTVTDLDVDADDHIVTVYDGSTVIAKFVNSATDADKNGVADENEDGDTTFHFNKIDDTVITIPSTTFSGNAAVVVTDVNSGLVLKVAQ
jgi:hypothetical protein